MIPYYFNEAMLALPSARSLVDLSRQHLEVVTEEGVAIDLIIGRRRAKEGEVLRTVVEATLADRRRTLRGFELGQVVEREYPGVVGIEVTLSFVDQQRGPRFYHELHCMLEGLQLGFHGISSRADAAVCDAWMRAMLGGLKLRG